MSKVINILAAMASNPSLVSNKEITALLANADISSEQKQAILAQDSERLAGTIADFAISMCGIVSSAEDDEQDSQDENKDKTTEKALAYAINS
ncbi:MAG: hypothetical protein HRT50_15425 [Colwellia sp.]|uniref:hypothetical protein n=1 Tax=Colwellia sp. TaxID=56799 RepID=UPI001D9FD228|nr:hypothetical protein [Colwellia sp.]NQY50462.1 hypothetical protein [Colwellia sp.]